MNSRLAVACLLVSGLMAAAPEQTLEELFAQSQAQFLAGDYLLTRDGFGKVWQEFAKTLTVLGPVSSGNSHNAMVARAAFALALRESGQLEKAPKILKEPENPGPPRTHSRRTRGLPELLGPLSGSGGQRTRGASPLRNLRASPPGAPMPRPTLRSPAPGKSPDHSGDPAIPNWRSSKAPLACWHTAPGAMTRPRPARVKRSSPWKSRSGRTIPKLARSPAKWRSS